MIPIWNEPPQKSDVLIIGGGLIGTSIAYQLAKRGIGCCLLERSHLASGASGRNDGQIILETVDYYPRMKEVYGSQSAYHILKFKREGQLALDQFLEPFCDLPYLSYHKDGSLTLAYHKQEADWIERASKEMIADGFPMELLDCDQIERLIGTRYFSMGKFDPADATVNPAELTRLFAAEARRLGATIVENCPVLEVESGMVRHAFGTTEAEVVILATNAYSAQLLPQFEQLVFPIRGQVLATEPTEHRIPGIGCITNFGYDYWHWTADGRLILGGRRFIDEHGEVGCEERLNPAVQEALETLMGEFYPTLTQTRIASRWSGIMGFSKDGIPIIGPFGGDPRLWSAVGFTGYGLGMCWSVSLAVAQTLNDEKSELSEILPMFSPSRFLKS